MTTKTSGFRERVARHKGGETHAPQHGEQGNPSAPFSRERPPLAEYLNPDLEHGRKRVIVMLSEDGAVVEPIQRLGLSQTNEVRILAQALMLSIVSITDIALQYETMVLQQVEKISHLTELVARLQGDKTKSHLNPPPEEAGS